MLRAKRGAGGQERDLGGEEIPCELEDIPCELEDGDEGGGHDRIPQQCHGTEGLPEGLVSRYWCCAMAGWESVTSANSRI